MSKWPTVSLAELLHLERRKVKIQPDQLYQEIGIYCFGRGIFHKTPRTGIEVGDKELFLMKEGDFILQVTFAWEGAIAIVSSAEDGMYGSTRYPTFRVKTALCEPKFLLQYFRTQEGISQIGRICPGSAGRNRVLSLKRINEIKIPLPPLSEQRRVVARIEELSAQIHEARTLRHEATQEAESLLSAAQSFLAGIENAPRVSIKELVGESGLRNGRSIKADGLESTVRCLTLSSMRNGRIDLNESKPVPVADDVAAQFRVRKNDVFVVRGNGSKELCGRAGMVVAESDGIIFPDLFIHVTVPPSKLLAEFFVTVWNSSTSRRVIEEMAKTTSGIWKINQGHILAMDIPLPAIEEQRRIVAELDALQAEVDALKRLQAETSAELDALLPAILDRAFKGEL